MSFISIIIKLCNPIHFICQWSLYYAAWGFISAVTAVHTSRQQPPDKVRSPTHCWTSSRSSKTTNHFRTESLEKPFLVTWLSYLDKSGCCVQADVLLTRRWQSPIQFDFDSWGITWRSQIAARLSHDPPLVDSGWPPSPLSSTYSPIHVHKGSENKLWLSTRHTHSSALNKYGSTTGPGITSGMQIYIEDWWWSAASMQQSARVLTFTYRGFRKFVVMLTC